MFHKEDTENNTYSDGFCKPFPFNWKYYFDFLFRVRTYCSWSQYQNSLKWGEELRSLFDICCSVSKLNARFLVSRPYSGYIWACTEVIQLFLFSTDCSCSLVSLGARPLRSNKSDPVWFVCQLLLSCFFLLLSPFCGLLKVPPCSCGVHHWPAAPWTPPVCPDMRNCATYNVCTPPKISCSPPNCSSGLANPSRHREVCDVQKSWKASHSVLLVSTEITSY